MGLFSNYGAVLLDASFFKTQLRDTVIEGILEKPTYVSRSYSVEVEQYKSVMSAEQKKIYEHNILCLKENTNRWIDIGAVNAEIGYDVKELNDDLWGVILFATRKKNNAKIVVVTASNILIQRIVLNECNVDIYDLNFNNFILPREHGRLKTAYQFKNYQFEDGINQDIQQDATKMYNSSGGEVRITGEEIASGLEARIYRIGGQSGKIAKIFEPTKLDANKYKNLLRIKGANNTLGIDWVVFPIDVLYYGNKKPAGYTQKYISNVKSLEDYKLFQQEENCIPRDQLEKRVSDTLGIAIKVVSQVCFLSCFGFLVSDFNFGNIAIDDEWMGHAIMWDTDSFCYGQYYSGLRAKGFNTYRKYGDVSRDKASAIDFCVEALYNFVFTLFSLGDPPIFVDDDDDNDRRFKYESETYRFYYRKKLFPEKLWTLFCGVFKGEKLPSLEMLLLSLVESKKRLEKNPNENLTYGELLNINRDTATDNTVTTIAKITTPEIKEIKNDIGSMVGTKGVRAVKVDSKTTVDNNLQNESKIKIKILIAVVIIGFLIGWIEGWLLNDEKETNNSSSEIIETDIQTEIEPQTEQE